MLMSPCGLIVTVQAASKRDAVHAAVMAADPSGEGYLSSEQLEQALAAAGLKFTRHQVRMLDEVAAYKVQHGLISLHVVVRMPPSWRFAT